MKTVIWLCIFYMPSLITDAQTQSRFQNDLNRIISNHKKFTGSILIAKKGQIRFHNSYLEINSNKEYLNTTFWIGSLSKQFCAVAILTLVDRGLLSLHDPISAYLENIPADKKNITPHQLLTHTSGLGNNYAADGIDNLQDALSSILRNRNEPLKTGYNYSNDGYQLLAILIEKITGLTYQEYLFNEIITYYSLTNIGHVSDNEKWSSLEVAVFNGKTKKEKNPQHWQTNYGFKGSTGILTSAFDLYNWFYLVLSNQILAPELTRLLFERHVPKNGIHYGYGWNIFQSNNGSVVVHSGDDDFIGHSSTLRYYPDDDLLIIVLSNAGYRKKISYARVVASKIIELVYPNTHYYENR